MEPATPPFHLGPGIRRDERSLEAPKSSAQPYAAAAIAAAARRRTISAVFSSRL